ncbi:anti-sigma regulatory factor (Ser/Thr protein kinase) [Streptomyces sp. 3330]|uniref:ATP-binding protein n=1 Tax=Streptomyces sp. 3330 TaxID=2817755 RepID=UPI00285826ED|nr:ATP-binding protein [Streptomyces sp. 3330]MDR6974072.1 anti-sigma regulatory factor (Ser/Thr protein kinase) [Streptomyces sp. 3330]
MEPVPPDQGSSAPGGNLAETTVALDGKDGCIARARRLTGDFLSRVQSRDGLAVSARAMDLSQLVVSELVTNALRHAPGPVLLQLRIAGAAVEIVVWDSDPALPVPRAPDPTRVGQHGLEIVRAVAEQFDVAQEPVGKRIVARLGLSD